MPHLKLKPPSQQSVSFNDISPFSSTVNLQPIAGSSHVSSAGEIPDKDSVITLSSDEEGRTFYYSSLMFAWILRYSSIGWPKKRNINLKSNDLTSSLLNRLKLREIIVKLCLIINIIIYLPSDVGKTTSVKCYLSHEPSLYLHRKCYRYIQGLSMHICMVKRLVLFNYQFTKLFTKTWG